jgi:hypothetical protein
MPRIGFGSRWIFLSVTTQPNVMAIYVRVLAKCTSRVGVTANRCKPFLTKIERFNRSKGEYTELHRDPLPLNWAFMGDTELDIHPNMAFHFDVLAINSDENVLRPQISVDRPMAWRNLLRKPGKYRFSVILAGENIMPAPLTFMFEWAGSFESLTEDCFGVAHSPKSLCAPQSWINMLRLGRFT